MLKNRLLFKNIANFKGITAKLSIVRVRNFQDPFETRKQSFISAFLFCMTILLSFQNLKMTKK